MNIQWPMNISCVIHPLLKCNNACPYCAMSNYDASFYGDEKAQLNAESIHYSQWIRALQRIDLDPGRNLMISGGEPLLYPGIEHIVNATPHLSRFVATNLQQKNAVDLIQRMNNQNFMLSISLHIYNRPNTLNPSIDQVLTNAKALYDLGYQMRIHSLRHTGIPKHTYQEIIEKVDKHQLTDVFSLGRASGIWNDSNFIDQEVLDIYGIDAFDGKNKLAHCTPNSLLIDPTGDVYHCYYALTTMNKGLSHGNVFNGTFHYQPNMLCRYYGKCHPSCMRVYKTSKRLSHDIKPITRDK